MKLGLLGLFLTIFSIESQGAPAQSAMAGATDPHPYQSQTIFRLRPQAGSVSGLIEVLLPKSIPQYTYFLPGDPSAHQETNIQAVYDKRNPLTETDAAGTNYLFTKGGYLSTVDAQGLLLYKGRVSYQPEILGGVYFIDANQHQVIAIDSYGYYVETGISISNPKVVGGNYLIDRDGVLTTIKSIGVEPASDLGIATRKTGWTFNDVISAGGNFFARSDGSVVTINSVNGFFDDSNQGLSKPYRSGGNFFIGEDCILYTVTFDGKIKANPDFMINSDPVMLGYSFMKQSDGKLISIDSDGVPHRSMMRVSTTGIRSRPIQSFEEELDQKAIFLPSILN